MPNNFSTSLKLSIFLAALAGLSIPISTAISNIVLALLLLVGGLSRTTWRDLPSIVRHPFVLACLVFYALFILGAFYSSATQVEVSKMLIKMIEYLFVPILFALCLNPSIRRSLLLGFALGVLINVLMSVLFAMWGEGALSCVANMNEMAGQRFLQTDMGDWSVFRTHTYHNFFAMLLGTGLLTLYLTKALDKKWNLLAGCAIFLCLVDILFLVQGRTIQAILLVGLAGLFVLWDRRIGLWIAAVVVLLVPLLLYVGSDNIRANVSRVGDDLDAYQHGKTLTSVGLRMDFHKNSLRLIEESPIFGHGTGSFAGEYRRLTGLAGDERASVNPHNDYLWIGVELGLVGVIAMLAIIAAMAIQARQCGRAERWMAWMLVFAMAVSTLGNSFFTDHITRNAFILLACALLAGNSFSRPDSMKST